MKLNKIIAIFVFSALLGASYSSYIANKFIEQPTSIQEHVAYCSSNNICKDLENY